MAPYRDSPTTVVTDKPVIYFYYDIASPFSYLALELLNRYAGKEWPDVALELRPCSLFHIRLWSANWPGPPENEFKMRSLMRDIVRMRKLYGVPIVPDNRQFPANATQCNQLLAYFKLHHPELLGPASMAFFEAYWKDQEPPADPTVVAKYIGPMFPGGESKLMELYNDKAKMESTEITDMLQAFSKEASEQFAVGTPFMIAVKPVPGGKNKVDSFFGSDRMEHIAQHLELPWLGNIPPSAKRTPGTELDYDYGGNDGKMYDLVKPLIDAVKAAQAQAELDAK